MRGAEEGARRARPDERRADGAVRAHARRGETSHRPAGNKRLAARHERPARGDDVRAAVERHPGRGVSRAVRRLLDRLQRSHPAQDRKSTRLNSSHGYISYAVFCLKKKKKKEYTRRRLQQASTQTA